MSDINVNFDISAIDDVLDSSLYNKDSLFSIVSPIYDTGDKYNGRDIHFVNLSLVKKHYSNICSAFSYAKTYVALKANSDHGIPELLRDLGANFEVATIEELRLLEELGVEGFRIMFTHPAKEAFEVVEAYRYGVDRFVTDSEMDLDLLARFAPKAKVIIRMMSDNLHKRDDVITNMDRFGAPQSDVCHLIVKAKNLGLEPIGVSFHIGTQEENPTAWNLSIEKAAQIFKSPILLEHKIHLSVLDIGGGFPAIYSDQLVPYQVYADTIKEAIKDSFLDSFPEEVIIEPGRSISAMAGITVGRVINVKPHQLKEDERIVTVSTGRFSAGLFGVGHSVTFFRRKSDCTFVQLPATNSIYGYLYGKACASFDTPKDGILIPLDLKEGDIVVFTGTGAYTSKMMTKWCSKANPEILVTS